MSRAKWLLFLLPVALLVLVVTRFTSLGKLWDTLSHARLGWVAIAAAVHVLFFVLHGLLYKYGFAAVDVRAGLWKLLPIFFASTYLNAVAPSGGTSGATVFIADARARGESPARATIGTVIVLIADLATLVPFLAGALWVLYRHHQLKLYEVLGIGAYLVFIVGLMVALVVARRREGAVRRALHWVQRQVARVAGWFHRDGPLSDDWAEIQSRDMCKASRAIANNPVPVARLALTGFAMHVVNLAGLYALFVAFEQRLTFGPALAGFALGIVFYVIAVVPQGVAAVEGVMGLVFTSLGVPAAKAIGIILAFRGMNFWLPLALGLFFLHRLGRVVEQGAERPERGESQGGAQAEGSD